MIRLTMVVLLVVIGALALAWLFTRDAKYSGYILRVLRFALVMGLLSALLYIVERIVLR